MTDIRLDPATLTKVAKTIEAFAFLHYAPNPASYEDYDGYANTALLRMAERIEGMASEAANRPATLSDFVRACEVSDMGLPSHSAGDEQAVEGDERRTLRMRWYKYPVAVDVIENGQVFIGTWPQGSYGWEWSEVATPADLTAALNALAKERIP